MSPELDARFAALAAQRIRAAPLRYYIWLPALRIADMWLRPRTELFPSDPRWWEFNDDRRWLTVSLAFGAINLLYVVMSLAGCDAQPRNLWRRPIRFFCVVALRISRQPGKSRAPLHARMLSRSVIVGLQPLPSR